MEFTDVIRRRHMVRAYADVPVPAALVDTVIDAGLRAPSAGFSQGWGFVVLEGEAQTATFWDAVAASPEPGGRWDTLRGAPVVVLPLAHKAAYLARYAEADKAGLGMDSEEGWLMPYWDIDVAFAVMSMLLAATDAGLGALFFAIRSGEAEVLAALHVPPGYRPIGALTIGWPGEAERRSPSLLRGRTPREQVVHYGRWSTPRPGPTPVVAE